jgi:D-alanyl-D-alanine carboxypeptidase (penicillin-binding protein 5/6)
MAMKNHNNLVEKVSGVDGLKSGFTNGAGFCLSATALRNGRRVIVVTMGSDQAKARDLKVAELLERGFAALPPSAPPVPAAPASGPSAPVADALIIPAPRPKAAASATPPPTAEQPIKFAIPKR